jgi:lactate dehydrogenase-like 2-hydroxyacid dehydrogenase
MKPKILLIEPMMEAVERRLDAAYDVVRLYRADDAAACVARHAADIRAVVTGGATGVPPAIMAALPHLEIVAINGIGTDAVDLAEAARRGIPVTTTPGVLTDDVADLALGLMLAASRRLCVGDRYVRTGGWIRREPLPLAHKVSGKRLGVFGMGRIGRAVARRAAAFDMSIAYTDLAPIPDLPFTFLPDVVTLAGASDILVVAATGGPGSRHSVGTAVFDALGPSGLLINVARGSIVDEAALVAALTEGRLGGAGLDVFADEPNVPDALLALDSVVVQPHRASATEETRLAMADLVLANLAGWFADRRAVTPVG